MPLRRAVLLASLLLARPAWAEDARDRSRAAFREGVELVQKNELARARDAFVRAYALFPHPSILLNLGLVRARLGEHVAAEQDLARFLSDDGGASQAEIRSARAALADARAHIGTLEVRASPASVRATLDGSALPLANGSITDARVAAGAHVIELSAEGRRSKTVRVQIVAGETASVEARLEAAAPAAEPEPRGASPIKAIVGGSLLGVGGVSIVIGVACGARAIALADAYNDRASDEYQKPSVKSAGIAFRTGADVAILSGAALAIGGVVLLLLPSSRATVSAGFGTLEVKGVF